MLAKTLVCTIILALSCTAALAAPATGSVDSGDGWKLASQAGSLSIYTRPHPGSSLKEFKAIGEFDAPPRTIRNVLADVEGYPQFMPRVKESRVLKREGDTTFVYQRVAPLFCSERAYTLRIELTADGGGYVCRWQLANAAGPTPAKGVIPMQANEGSWMLEPIGDHHTRVTYYIFNEAGGSIPSFLSNYGNQAIIGQLFAAVRKQALLPKYQG